MNFIGCLLGDWCLPGCVTASKRMIVWYCSVHWSIDTGIACWLVDCLKLLACMVHFLVVWSLRSLFVADLSMVHRLIDRPRIKQVDWNLDWFGSLRSAGVAGCVGSLAGWWVGLIYLDGLICSLLNWRGCGWLAKLAGRVVVSLIVRVLDGLFPAACLAWSLIQLKDEGPTYRFHEAFTKNLKVPVEGSRQRLKGSR